MHQVSKLQINNLNDHLTCLLCRGYFIEATTIIECLHSFCKSCIVRYLETNKFCPVCDVQVHKTKPLLNIRSDQTLQDIVYKLVPGLFQHEMRLRREFYSKHPDQLPLNPQDRGEVTEQFIYSSDETICLSLEYADDDNVKEVEKEEVEDESHGKRFLRCPAAVTVGLLKRLIRGKYGLDCNHALDILYGDSFLCDEYSLVDLAYIYNWRRKGPMRLRYRIYTQRLLENPSMVNGGGVNNNCTEPPVKLAEQEAKEVQLEISESGVMSVLNVDTRNGVTEETHSTVFPTDSEEKPPESSAETETTDKPTPPEATNGSVEEQPPVICSADDDKTNADPPVVDSTPPPPPPPTVARNKNPVHKTLKPPPTSSWNRIGIKRTNDNNSPADLAAASPAKRATPSKTPRFFKVRNSSSSSSQQPTTTTTTENNTTATSIASVTESPVQEVAVNLTKVSTSPKKTERSSPRPSAADNLIINPIRPYSAPAPSAQSQQKRQSPSLAVEDAAARLRHLLNPSPTTSSSSEHLTGFPSAAAAAWLNLARGAPNRPLGTPFGNRPPPLSPAHFISSFIASHPHYPYLPPMGLPPPAPEGKKSLPASTSSSSSVQHKPVSPRTTSSFPTPTFNLNALQQCAYPPGLSPLLPALPRELVGSFYHSSYVPRPFMTGRGRGSPSPKSSPSSSSSSSSSGGGGFHPSLPPTVTSSSSGNKKSAGGLRPIVPRRTVAPPPPLVPIGPAAVRSPPTLLPIKDVVEPTNCVKVVESLPAAAEDVSEPAVDSRVEDSLPSPKENGNVSAEVEKVKPEECTSKTEEENNSVAAEESSNNKVEVAL